MNRVLIPAILVLVVLGVGVGVSMYLLGSAGDSAAIAGGGGDPDAGRDADPMDVDETAEGATPVATRNPVSLDATKTGDDEAEGPTGDYVMSGRVVRQEDGAPIAGARVVATSRLPSFAPVDIQSEIQNEFGNTTPAPEQSLQKFDWTDPDQAEELGGRNQKFRRPGVVTDENGQFTVTGLPRPSAYLDAEFSGRALVHRGRVNIESGTRRDGLVLEMARAAMVTGTVHDPAGQPVKKAKVNLLQPFDPYSVVSGGGFSMNKGGELWTDEDGKFEFLAVPAGEYQLMVGAEDLESNTSDLFALAPGQHREIPVVLSSGAVLQVQVLDKNRNPIERARVRLSPAQIDLSNIMANAERWNQSERSGDDGLARLLGLGAGEAVVHVSHGDYLPAEQTTVSLTSGEVTELTVELIEGARLQGLVTDAEGNPLEGASVRASPPRSFASLMNASAQFDRKRERTGEDGRFTMNGLPSGTLEVKIEARDYRTVELEAEAGGADLNVTLEPLSAIEGIVVSRVTGAPVEEFQIEAERKQSGFGFDFEQMGKDMLMQRALPIRTDNGRFRLTGVEPGQYKLTIEAEGHAASASDWIEVAENEVRKGLLFYLGPEAALAGTVVDADTKQPVAGTRVLMAQGSNPIEQVMEKMFGDRGQATGEDGTWRISGLSTGRYQLQATHPDYATTMTSKIEAREGETTQGVVIELNRGAEVYGFVYGPNGQPAADVTIFINDATSTNLKSAKSGADGGYRIQALSAGQYVMTRLPSSFNMAQPNEMMEQFSGGMGTHNVSLAAGESRRQDFGLERKGDGSLEGQVLQAGVGLDGVFVTVIGSGDTYSWQGSGGLHTALTTNGGQFRIKGLKPGPAQVQVQVMGESMALPESLRMQEVQILADSTTTLTIELPGGSAIGVVVDGNTRQPLAGIPVYASRQNDSTATSVLQAYTSSRASFAHTEEDGSFVLRNLDSGHYRIVVGSRDLLGLTDLEYGMHRVDDVYVPEGGTADVGQVSLSPAATLTGEVTSTRDGLIAGATVFLRRPDSDDLLEQFSLTTTDPGGQFELQGAPEGEWDVLCRAAGHAIAETRVRLRSGETAHVEFELMGGTDVYLILGEDLQDDPGEVSLHVTGPNGRIVSGLFGLSDLTSGLLSAITAGEYYVGCFDAGKYRATGQIRGKAFDQEFVLAGEAERRIPIDLPD